MKVYLLIEEGYNNDSGGYIAVEVYNKRELAEKELDQIAEIVKNEGAYDTFEYVEKDYVDNFNAGWYDRYHHHVYIEEQEVKGE